MVLQQRHSKTEFSSGGIVYKIENNSPLWLVTQHSKHKGWSFPKGLIGDKVDGESKEATALREVEEEGGVQAKIINNVPFVTKYCYYFRDQQINKTVYFYLMEYISGNIDDHDWEVSEAKWLSKDDVIKQLSFKEDREIFEKAVLSL